MLGKILSGVSTVFSSSSFDTYLNQIQASEGPYAATEREARSDFARSLKAVSLPW